MKEIMVDEDFLREFKNYQRKRECDFEQFLFDMGMSKSEFENKINQLQSKDEDRVVDDDKKNNVFFDWRILLKSYFDDWNKDIETKENCLDLLMGDIPNLTSDKILDVEKVICLSLDKVISSFGNLLADKDKLRKNLSYLVCFKNKIRELLRKWLDNNLILYNERDVKEILKIMENNIVVTICRNILEEIRFKIWVI